MTKADQIETLTMVSRRITAIKTLLKNKMSNPRDVAVAFEDVLDDVQDVYSAQYQNFGV